MFTYIVGRTRGNNEAAKAISFPDLAGGRRRFTEWCAAYPAETHHVSLTRYPVRADGSLVRNKAKYLDRRPMVEA